MLAGCVLGGGYCLVQAYLRNMVHACINLVQRTPGGSGGGACRRDLPVGQQP